MWIDRERKERTHPTFRMSFRYLGMVVYHKPPCRFALPLWMMVLNSPSSVARLDYTIHITVHPYSQLWSASKSHFLVVRSASRFLLSSIEGLSVQLSTAYLSTTTTTPPQPYREQPTLSQWLPLPEPSLAPFAPVLLPSVHPRFALHAPSAHNKPSASNLVADTPQARRADPTNMRATHLACSGVLVSC